MLLTLQTVVYRNDCTLGVLLYETEPVCVTLEDPWNFNNTGVSCVPRRTYSVVPWNSAKFPNTFNLVDVPNRSAILIHAGNTADNTEGCILVGEMYGTLNNKIAVLNSAKALDKLRLLLKDKTNILLEIK